MAHRGAVRYFVVAGGGGAWDIHDSQSGAVVERFEPEYDKLLGQHKSNYAAAVRRAEQLESARAPAARVVRGRRA